MNKNLKKWLAGVIIAITCGIIAGFIYDLNSDSNSVFTTGIAIIFGIFANLIYGWLSSEPEQNHIRNIRNTAERDQKDLEKPHKITPSIDIKNSPNILPYAIKQFCIKNYHAIIKTHIKDLPVDTQWIFLTGENGFGKTLFLRALVLGLYGKRDKQIVLTDEQCSIEVEFKNNTENQINSSGEPVQFVNFAGYGPSRLVVQSSKLGNNKEEEKSAITYSLFNNDGILLNIETELGRWFFNPKFKGKYKKVKEILLKMLPDITDINVAEDGKTILYTEKESAGTSNVFGDLPFNKLASGHQSIIAMVGDMIVRLLERQEVDQDIDDPSGLSGIVIIDELDLHLHPKMQKEMPILLSKIFPKVQFIVSTHSVIPLMGAPEGSIFLKVSRDITKGIEVEKIDIDIANLLPNSILTSPLFGLESILSGQNKDFFKLWTEHDYNEIESEEKRNKKLKEIAQKGDMFPKEFFEPEDD